MNRQCMERKSRTEECASLKQFVVEITFHFLSILIFQMIHAYFGLISTNRFTVTNCSSVSIYWNTNEKNKEQGHHSNCQRTIFGTDILYYTCSISNSKQLSHSMSVPNMARWQLLWYKFHVYFVFWVKIKFRATFS